jgi:adenylate cyclase
MFGDETTLQLIRVTGSALAQVADAMISAFIVDLARPTMAEDPSGLALLRANIDTLKLLPQISVAMDTVLRHHLLALRRVDALEGPPGDFETRILAVGFTDLVDSSGLAQQVSMSELGARLRQFETRAVGLVMGGGGRVIKHIGDEVMFVAADPVSACRIALDLVGAFATDPALPSARSGVACGEVLVREGDCFGPVVNLAARLVEAATPNTLLVSDAVRDAVAAEPDLRVGANALQQLKGFADPLTVAPVTRVDAASRPGRATL